MNREALLERLRNEDEVVLLDILELTSDQIVDCFIDVIDEKADILIRKYEEEY